MSLSVCWLLYTRPHVAFILFLRNMSYATAGDSFDDLTMASVRTLQNASFSKTPLLLPCPGDTGQGMFSNGEQLSDCKRGIILFNGEHFNI